MIKKIITIVLFTSCVFSISNAEIVKQIIIKGNKRISDETIKVYGDIKLNKDLSESNVNEVINNLYSTDFFESIDAKIENNILKINLVEYEIINRLIITGEKKKANKEQIKKLIQLKEKKSFIKSYLAKDIEIIKKLYSSLGYNFSTVDAKIKKTENNNLDLVIEINRGEKTQISSINFLGNKKIRSKRLKDIIASEEHKFWKFLSKNTSLSENLINLDKRLLLNYYKSIGFYDIKINSNFAEINELGEAKLIYNIDEGKRYTINKISTNIDTVLDKKIFFPLNKSFKKYAGDYYSPFKVKKILEELDQLIENNNLQFIEHNVKETAINDSINIVFNIFEGEKNLIERINVTGNYATNENVIRGELLLDEGDPLTNINLEKSIAEIKQRRIFKTVTHEVVEGSKKNLKIININVEEQPTGEVGAGAGIGTSGGTIAFNIKENNWLGEGKSVALDVQLDEESIVGGLTFSNPNYDFLGNSLNYNITSEQNDKPDQGYENTIISTGIGTSFEQYKNVRVNLGLSASYDDLRTESSATASLKKQSGNFGEIAGQYGFTIDNRDRVFMPTSGSIMSFGQTFPFYADKSFISNTLTLSKYKSLNENVVGSGKLFLSAINGLGGDDARISKRKGLSSKRLRGFERNKIGPVDGNDHVGGNYAAAINFETNLPKLLPENTNADISLFLDFGSVWGVDYDSTIDESNKLRSSTGAALNWLSPIGPMNFVLSQNLSKASTDKTESFAFNLGTTF
ncbi:outer membrane protein assembly factor BamA [Pelagibacteraceae bacterium]|nr:outer membrane protein assembly factor BamA [Pelagibacteraceae bacterium]